jgi:hypothetical protein
MRTTVQKFLPVAVIAAFVAACADAPTSNVGIAPNLPSRHVLVTTPSLELADLCKAGPVGLYTFNATATHAVLRDAATGNYDQTAATYTIDVTAGSTIDLGGGNLVPGACYTFTNAFGTHNHIALGSGGTDATVTVVETGIPAGVDFDHVVVYQNTGGSVSSTSSATNSAVAHVGGSVAGNLGASILFYNVPEPPPPGGCTYTKGWYRNNGSSTVVDVDGRSAADARTIFAATPGKPNGVSWGADNNNLNLYQQLLAALLNGGASGPAAVQTAIADAQAATGGAGLVITVAAGTDVSGLISTLSAFNEGTFAGWPHCAD